MSSLRKTIIAAGLLLLALPAPAATLHPFTTDGCSMFLDGTLAQQVLWRDCCVAHDRAYWLGGTFEERLRADQELRDCVAAVGEPQIGVLMLAGVRVGGTPFLPTPFRWGYGWDELRGYRELTFEEKAWAVELIAPGSAASPPLTQETP